MFLEGIEGKIMEAYIGNVRSHALNTGRSFQVATDLSATFVPSLG